MAANPANPFELPPLPTAPTYENIMQTIRSIGGLPTLGGGVMPEIRGLLGQGGPALAPGIQAIQERTSADVAAAQSDAMRRGLTGSSIEAFGMGQARAGGTQAEAQFRAQGAQSLAELLFRAQSGDIQAATQLRQMIAQAMGQELGSQRDIQMFQQQLSSNEEQAAKNRQAQMWSSLIGGAGAIGGGALSNPALISDRRVKTRVRKIGSVGGLDIVRFRWGKRAAEAGLKPGGPGIGVIAQQVQEVYPYAVVKKGRFLAVDYDRLPEDVAHAVISVAGGKL